MCQRKNHWQKHWRAEGKILLCGKSRGKTREGKYCKPVKICAIRRWHPPRINKKRIATIALFCQSIRQYFNSLYQVMEIVWWMLVDCQTDASVKWPSRKSHTRLHTHSTSHTVPIFPFTILVNYIYCRAWIQQKWRLVFSCTCVQRNNGQIQAGPALPYAVFWTSSSSSKSSSSLSLSTSSAFTRRGASPVPIFPFSSYTLDSWNRCRSLKVKGIMAQSAKNCMGSIDEVKWKIKSKVFSHRGLTPHFPAKWSQARPMSGLAVWVTVEQLLRCIHMSTWRGKERGIGDRVVQSKLSLSLSSEWSVREFQHGGRRRVVLPEVPGTKAARGSAAAQTAHDEECTEDEHQ